MSEELKELVESRACFVHEVWTGNGRNDQIRAWKGGTFSCAFAMYKHWGWEIDSVEKAEDKPSCHDLIIKLKKTPTHVEDTDLIRYFLVTPRQEPINYEQKTL